MAFKIFSSCQPGALTQAFKAPWSTGKPHYPTSMIWGSLFLFLWSLTLLKTAQFLLGPSMHNIIIAFSSNGLNPSCSYPWILLALGLQENLESRYWVMAWTVSGSQQRTWTSICSSWMWWFTLSSNETEYNGEDLILSLKVSLK